MESIRIFSHTLSMHERFKENKKTAVREHRSLAMIQKDILLWRILAILGINISEYKLGPCEKHLTIPILFVFALLLLHSSSAIIYLMIKDNFVGGITVVLQNLQVFLVWYILTIKQTHIRDTLKTLYKYRHKYVKDKSKSDKIRSVLIVTILLPFVIACLHVIFVSDKTEWVNYWLLDYTVPGSFFNTAIFIYGVSTHYICITFIIFFTISLSMVYYRWGEILESYSKSLERRWKKEPMKIKVEYLKEYFRIVNSLQKTNKTMKYLSLLIISYSLEIIFSSLHLAIKHDKMHEFAFSCEVIFNFICGLVMLLTYTLSSSVIPEQMHEIKKAAKKYINTYGNNIDSQDVLFYLHRIENEDIVYISAGGMFELTRGFILTAIGTTLTYDLLIINFE